MENVIIVGIVTVFNTLIWIEKQKKDIILFVKNIMIVIIVEKKLQI
jgi:hypothetical protein